MKQFNLPSTQLDTMVNYRLKSYERMEYSQDWKCYEHMHSFTEIFFVTGGEGTFHTEEIDIPLHRGMIIVNTPSVTHTEYSSENNPLSYAVFAIENLTFRTNETEEGQKTFCFDFSAHYEEIFNVLRVIEAENVKKKPFWQFAILTEFNKFMLFLFRNTSLISLPFDSSSKPNSLSQIHLYLRSRYQENISLDKLAELFFLNKYYLAHAFKKKYGISIIRFLNQVRCNEAKTLLEVTDLSITEIAISVGYNSSSHFSEIYKKTLGEPPAQTRKNFFAKNK